MAEYILEVYTNLWGPPILEFVELVGPWVELVGPWLP